MNERVYWLWAFNRVGLHGSEKCANTQASAAYRAERIVLSDTSMYNLCRKCGHLARGDE